MNKLLKDNFILSIVLSFVILLSLFIYLFKIETSIKDYNNYKSSLTKLKLLDKEFEHFFLRKDKFVNYDEIVLQTKTFENALEELSKSNLANDFGDAFNVKLQFLNNLYLKKLDYIEVYKSNQATILNSIHFLFDLNNSFQKDDQISKDLRFLLNSTMFMLLQNFIEINDNSKQIVDNLELIKNTNISLSLNEKFHFLYTHSMKLLKLKKRAKNTSTSALKIKLEENIDNTILVLENKYEKRLFEQLIIALLFFIISLLMSAVLVKIYLNRLKIQKELSAFKYAVEHSDNSIILTDENRKMVYVNENYENNSGYRKGELLGHNPKIISSGLTPIDSYIELNEKLNAGKKWDGEFINKRKDGSIFYEKASIVPIFINNELVNYLAIKLDITKYIKQQEELKESAIVFENTQEGILVTDKNWNILSVNQAYEKFSGYKKEELIGNKPNIITLAKHDRNFYKKVSSKLKLNDHWKGKVFDIGKDDAVIPTWLNITAVRDEKGVISKYISIHTNLQEIVDTQEKADYLAYHDRLTGLPNRIRLEEHLTHVLDVARRNDLTLSVLFIDLDRFKIINDTLGHQIGDRLLQTVSSRIKSVLRQSDMLARMGGDEFVVVLETAQNKNSAAFVCNKILEVIKDPIVISEHKLNTTASIGVAMYPDDGDNLITLVKHADAAMYHAKNKGKNTFEYYNKQLSIDVHDQLQIEQALKNAVIKDELYLHYQPQYTLNTKRLKSLEALVRWENKELGFVSPAMFIPIAEESGAIIEIGDFIFERACKDFMNFKEVNKELEYIAINISSVQFRNPDFISNIKSIIEKVGISPRQIELEITERYIMDFNESNMSLLDELKDIGFKMSIDDFGTGYSSMSYLNKLPIDTIKIDKAFIDGIPNDNSNTQISKTIINLAKSLGYKTVAEGIEEEEQSVVLKELGCDLAQGYLYSKPKSYTEILKILEK